MVVIKAAVNQDQSFGRMLNQISGYRNNKPKLLGVESRQNVAIRRNHLAAVHDIEFHMRSSPEPHQVPM